MFGDVLYQSFREFKSIWDPQWKMNPGKKIDAYGVAENLRIGADYNPPQPATNFHFAGDKHSFARAALRCVGVGDCRRAGRPGHVPQLSGHARREGLHARPGAPALRDDERRGADRRLEK